MPAERILDEQGALVESTQSERAEVDIPYAVVDLDQSDELLTQGLADVDPLLVPADAAVASFARWVSGGSDMDAPPRRRVAVSVVPMLVGLLAAQRAAPHVRTVDIVLLFAGGIAFGVGLIGLIQLIRARWSGSA